MKCQEILSLNVSRFLFAYLSLINVKFFIAHSFFKWRLYKERSFTYLGFFSSLYHSIVIKLKMFTRETDMCNFLNWIPLIDWFQISVFKIQIYMLFCWKTKCKKKKKLKNSTRDFFVFIWKVNYNFVKMLEELGLLFIF